MDNFKIDITAKGRDSLAKALEIAFSHNAAAGKAESYEIVALKSDVYNGTPENLDGRTALVFRRSKDDGRKSAVPLPFKLDAAGAADWAERWLAETDYGREPDHDGHNGKGWRVFTGSWGHVCGDHYAVCAVLPAWAMYGK
ncbi:hypothetical protein [Rhizobium leguminosarum]|jgi:hypothetical protein|uniref:hypothetical protein n=1 Tax=Rhizobium leguminosarum TaxID=384 RepID=UPI002E129A74|nr:hypothetical protein U8Q02_40860 [Rhizobium leguminosarum]